MLIGLQQGGDPAGRAGLATEVRQRWLDFSARHRCRVRTVRDHRAGTRHPRGRPCRRSGATWSKQGIVERARCTCCSRPVGATLFGGGREVVDDRLGELAVGGGDPRVDVGLVGGVQRAFGGVKLSGRGVEPLVGAGAGCSRCCRHVVPPSSGPVRGWGGVRDAGGVFMRRWQRLRGGGRRCVWWWQAARRCRGWTCRVR